MLEKHVIIHGVVEAEEEASKQLKEKVQEVLSHTVNMPTQEERTGIACNIPIANTERIGCYNEQHNRPISVTFENKCDSELLLKRKKKLPEGVFIDKEYCYETEKERQFL